MEKPTIILFEGYPYRLRKVSAKLSNNPCSVCDLNNVCSDASFIKLCQPNGYDTSWAFVEAWDLYNDTVDELI